VQAWVVTELGKPMLPHVRSQSVTEAGAEHEVLVKVAGCGVCHTDLGFFYEGIPTRHPLPLTLGHEVSGTVVEAGAGARNLLGRQVIVPAVLPCGDCQACRAGRGSICPRQVFPGNDVHGGFASHLQVPARALCLVPDLEDRAKNPLGISLPTLSVIADAVSTPYQALVRSGLQKDDLAVFIGAGGVGGFGVQIAKALGAHVIAIDPDPGRLALVQAHGADLCLPSTTDLRARKAEVAAFRNERGVPSFRTRVFETSGTRAGQETAFGLLDHGTYLSVVGFTKEKVELRLSNVMAFDATIEGNWACLPEHYPAVLDLVLGGEVKLAPFVEFRPLAAINEVFADLHARRTNRRVILVP
jgi:6-hydroxycyclohex-1-ene-1-carbonyl-CoA dehydrogenase